jgi:hypothetical protein
VIQELFVIYSQFVLNIYAPNSKKRRYIALHLSVGP